MTAHYALVGQNGILEPRRFLGDEIRLEIMHLSPRLEIMHLSPLQFCLQVLKISANWQVVDIWLDGIVPIFSVWELRYKRQSPSTKLSHGVSTERDAVGPLPLSIMVNFVVRVMCSDETRGRSRPDERMSRCNHSGAFLWI